MGTRRKVNGPSEYKKDIFHIGNILKYQLVGDRWGIKKYEIDTCSEKYLLVCSDNSEYINELEERLQMMKDNHICTNMVVNRCININDESLLLLKWINGEMVSNILEQLDYEDVIKLGYSAGKILKKIHDIQLSDKVINKQMNLISAMSTLNRIDSIISSFTNVKAERFSGSKKFYEYICSQVDYIKLDEMSVLHGDFQLSNMIYTNDHVLLPIDFVPGLYGESSEDFVRSHVSAEINNVFATAQIVGYYNGDVPEGFWEKLKFFTALHQIEMIDWVEIAGTYYGFVEHQHKWILKSYDDMSCVVPRWFRRELML